MYLIGASGHGKVIIDILHILGLRVEGLIDDDPARKQLWDIPVVGNTFEFDPCWGPCIISIGNNKLRKEVAGRVSTKFISAVHPRTFLASSTTIGEGTVMMAGAVVNPDTQIGKHVIINTRASLDHDNRIADYVHIAPGSTLCGGVTVGEGTLVGAGATILPNVTIGKWAVVGAGAVVTKDVPDQVTVVGNPAKIMQPK